MTMMATARRATGNDDDDDDDDNDSNDNDGDGMMGDCATGYD